MKNKQLEIDELHGEIRYLQQTREELAEEIVSYDQMIKERLEKLRRLEIDLSESKETR